MKKKILVGLLSTGMILGLCGCYTKEDCKNATDGYDRVIIELPNGESFEGKLEDCSTFVSSAGGISVTLHGVKYYTHISNVILIDTKED